MMKVISKTLFTAAAILFCAGFTGCKCCADEKKACDPKDTNPNDACNCPVLLVIGEDEEQIGDCTVCTVWCQEYTPCMNAAAACPAIAKHTLKDAPLCAKCKDAIMANAPQRKACAVCGKEAKPCAACTDKLHNSKVKDLMSAASMKANMNCKECKKTTEAAAKAKAEAIKKDAAADDDADDDDDVVVVEEVDAVVVPVPAPADDTKKTEEKK